MKKALIIGVISLLAAGGLYAKDLTLNEVIAQSAKDVEGALPEGTTVAVVNFTSPSEVFSDYVIEELIGALVNGKKVVIVDRGNLDLVRDEMNLQLSGDVSDESMLSIGKQLGAHYLVSGTLTNMGRYYRFRVTVISVETAVIQTQNSLNLKNDSQVTALIVVDSEISSVAAAAYFGKQKVAVNIIGMEINMNSTRDVATAFGVNSGFDINLGRFFAIGANIELSVSELFVAETTALFRWYFFNNLFLQADAGLWAGSFLNSGEYDENSDFSKVRLLAGASVGIRIPVGRNFYVEPYARVGHPFMLGSGAKFGLRIPFVGSGDPIGGMTGRGASARGTGQQEPEPAAQIAAEPVKKPTFEEEVAAIVSEFQDNSIWLEFDSEGRARLMVSVVFAPNSTEFEGLSADVMASNERTLRYVADILKRARYSNIIIEGHSNPTSAAGRAREREENELKLLSRLRALTVVDELRQLGVNLDRRNVVGAGSDRLVAPYNDQQNNWKNRRVEFILVQ